MFHFISEITITSLSNIWWGVTWL